MKNFTRRLYKPLIEQHFSKNRQMLFLMGPRQVGKTTLCLLLRDHLNSSFVYLNWDNLDDREILIRGPKAIAEHAKLDQPKTHPPLIVLDEIHKYKEWKILLKGFFDTYSHSGEVRILVTGSARLDVYNVGGDSLMGRYFRYRVHPFSVGELVHDMPIEQEIRNSAPIEDERFEALLRYGGFPEPFLKADEAFYHNWRVLRSQQFFQEDVRELTQIQEIQQMELLALHVRKACGALTSYATLAKKIRISNETVRRWIETLKQLYYCFPLHPWSKNIPRSLLKEPKFYLWDWALVEDEGARAENFIASHLLKACHYWSDRGLGAYALYFLRNKEKQEVDFLVTKNDEAWFLVEAKLNSGPLSPHLKKFQELTGAKHAFQVSVHAEYEEIDCFSYHRPVTEARPRTQGVGGRASDSIFLS